CLLSAFRTRRRPRPTLLPYTTLFRSDIDVEMEESDQAPAETEGRDAPFKARPAMRVEKSADKLINPEAQQVVSEVAAKPKKRGPSLFERMTGVSRSFRKESGKEEAAAPVRREPVSSRVAPQVSEQALAPQSPQVRKEVTPSVNIDQKQEDEDLLDIPAFLRRHANSPRTRGATGQCKRRGPQGSTPFSFVARGAEGAVQRLR